MTLSGNFGRNYLSSDLGVVSEVEIFAGCLKDDGIDAVFSNERMPFENEMTVPICCVDRVCLYKVQIDER